MKRLEKARKNRAKDIHSAKALFAEVYRNRNPKDEGAFEWYNACLCAHDEVYAKCKIHMWSKPGKMKIYKTI